MAKLKTKDELLKDLSKANKTRKEILANRAGFSTVEDYKKHLQGFSEPKSEAVKPKIHIVNILDVSSSMSGGKFEKAFSGIVNEVKEFQTDTNTDYTATFVSFSYEDQIKRHYFNTPISQVKTPILHAEGMTALNRAVGETLEGLLLLDNKDVKTIVSIFTDGGENASRGSKYASKDSVAEVIKEAEKAGITITFIGTEYDTKTVIQDFGIKFSNTLVHDNTADSIAKSFKTKLGATIAYSANVSRGASQEELLTGFYQKSTGKL
jgi:uncharacterized protein YegL